jgi:hypothetical protein
VVTVLVERIGSTITAHIPAWTVDITSNGGGVIGFSVLIPASLRPTSLCLYPTINAGLTSIDTMWACDGSTGLLSLQPTFTASFSWTASPGSGPYGPTVLSWKAQ